MNLNQILLILNTYTCILAVSMKIKDVKVLMLEGGPLPPDGRFKDNPSIGGYGGREAEHPHNVTQPYVKIVTEEGVDGLSPGFPSMIAPYIIRDLLKPVLLGKDPQEYEALWIQMRKAVRHGRRGVGMLAIAAVDLALWDIMGKIANAPVYRLLGGIVQDNLQTYRAMLGLNTSPESVAKYSIKGVEEGFSSFKWYLHYGPSSGVKGLQANVQLVKTFRDAVGYDMNLMLDCSRLMSLHYMFKLCKRIERYEITWIEEPFYAEELHNYSLLAKSTSIPIAGIENVYDRWAFKDIIEKEACSILQPDIGWVGGLTEVIKIAALASAYGLPIIPHANESFRASLHFVTSRPETLCPLQEYNPLFQARWQYFYKNMVKAQNGCVTAPSTPGLGIEFDTTKIVKMTEM